MTRGIEISGTTSSGERRSWVFEDREEAASVLGAVAKVMGFSALDSVLRSLKDVNLPRLLVLDGEGGATGHPEHDFATLDGERYEALGLALELILNRLRDGGQVGILLDDELLTGVVQGLLGQSDTSSADSSALAATGVVSERIVEGTTDTTSASVVGEGGSFGSLPPLPVSEPGDPGLEVDVLNGLLGRLGRQLVDLASENVERLPDGADFFVERVLAKSVGAVGRALLELQSRADGVDVVGSTHADTSPSVRSAGAGHTDVSGRIVGGATDTTSPSVVEEGGSFGSLPPFPASRYCAVHQPHGTVFACRACAEARSRFEAWARS